jgi:hypothetical protein
VVKRYDWPTDRPAPPFDQEVENLDRQINTYARKIAEEVDAYNSELATIAREAITKRRERTLAARSHLDSLQIPVRQRQDAPTTYQAPGIERVPPPVPPPGAPERAKMPEPVLIGKFYEHIVKLIRVWAKAIERTPAPFREMDEETLRAALLPMLNSHYEGGATGETFNAGGKIDILVRVEDRNIFIGECKKWKGENSLAEALNQIFKYSTWRDTKLALLLFVNRDNISDIVQKTKAWLQSSEQFSAWEESGDERELRCAMHWPTDPQVTATLHVSFVHLPSAPNGRDLWGALQ